MGKQFDVIFLEEVLEYLKSIEKKHSEKIVYNVSKSQSKNDPELFKKIADDIWEFRTLYQKLHYRLLAFWDKTDSENTLVIATNGFIKKQSKVAKNQIKKAISLREKYFVEKEKRNKL